MTDQLVIEAMLMSWSDSPAGRKVTFLLPDNGEDHPFKHLKAGTKYGQRLALSVALINDDETETPVEQEQHETAGAAQNGRSDPHHYSRQAGIWCGEERFHNFLDSLSHSWRSECSGDMKTGAAKFVRYWCGVQSRAEFDTDPVAARRWRGLMADFDVWRGMG